jgi:hypothetical protein
MTDYEWLRQQYAYDPDTGVFTRLTRWGTKQVGDEAGSLAWNGYRYLSVNKKPTPAHRAAWLYVHGHWPPNDIDHINRDRADNRLVNLRAVTRSTNLHNGPVRASETGIPNVYRRKDCAKWTACIRVNYKQHNLGYFDTVEEAIAARDEARARLVDMPGREV